MNRIRKSLVVLAITAVTMTVAGAAFAAWVAKGQGNGYTQATTAKDLTTLAASTSAQLFPGATGDLFITVKNDNPYPVRVTDVETDGAITSDKGSACDASTGVSFTDQHLQTLNVPANGSASFQVTGAVAMSNASDNSCQGATFTVPTKLTGVSAAS
ncbi:MAG: hypothetical protein ACRDZ3_20400 [Acidimicrobiia bacterium]